MAEHSPILLAEDREDDILLIRKAFAAAHVPNPLHVVRDGEEAIAYLSGEGSYAIRSEFPLPDLFLLDLKMPRLDGFEVLERLPSATIAEPPTRRGSHLLGQYPGHQLSLPTRRKLLHGQTPGFPELHPLWQSD